MTVPEPARAAEAEDARPRVELHEVRLLCVPVAVHARSQEHGAELMREMYLIAQQLQLEGDSAQATALPARLIALVEALTAEYSPLTTEQDRQLEEAIVRGADAIDLVYRIPAAAADAAAHLGKMLDEADEFCREGKHLLTLATPAELVRYRHWYLGEFVTQIAGGAATPWPEYVGPA